jgi:hypothetical protein
MAIMNLKVPFILHTLGPHFLGEGSTWQSVLDVKKENLGAHLWMSVITIIILNDRLNEIRGIIIMVILVLSGMMIGDQAIHDIREVGVLITEKNLWTAEMVLATGEAIFLFRWTIGIMNIRTARFSIWSTSSRRLNATWRM